MDPRYPYGGYAPPAQDSHAHMGHAVEFQNVEIGEKSSKKRRGNLPKHTTDILRAWLHDHLDHAYPNEEQKQHLIRETGLSGFPVPRINKSATGSSTPEEGICPDWWGRRKRKAS
ncbi:MAG: hypothetical protein Q9202_005602 [Teloschistes flavicans]